MNLYDPQLNNLVNKYQQDTDQIINSYSGKWDCQEGCAYCCSGEIWLYELEGAYIAQQIMNVFPLDQQHKIKDTANGKCNGNISLDAPCIFLENNKCIIYPFRPTPCRKYFSNNVKHCMSDQNDIFSSIDINIKDACHECVIDFKNKLNQIFLSVKIVELNIAISYYLSL